MATFRTYGVVALALLAACSGSSDDDTLSSGSIRSVRNLSGTNVVGVDAVVDANHASVFLAALQSGEADYGSGTVGRASTEPPTLVLIRYDEQLQLLWQDTLTAQFLVEAAPHIAVDAGGTLALAISGFEGTADVGLGPAAGSLVAAYAIADGSVRWSTSLGEDVPRGIVVDPSGDVVTVSTSDTEIVIDRLAAASGAVLVRLPLGVVSGSAIADGISVDSEGNLGIVGTFDGTYILNDTYAEVGSSAFVTKVERDSGASLWSRHVRLRDDSEHLTVATLANDDIAIAGAFAFADDPNDASDPLGPTRYIRIAVLSTTSGALVWNTRYELPNAVSLTIADLADGTDDVYAALTFAGTLQIDSLTATSTTTSTQGVLRLSGSDGTPQWLRYSETSAAKSVRIGLDSNGDALAVGTFTATTTEGASLESVFTIEVVN